MKYYGSVLDFTEQRNKELMNAYRKHIIEANVVIMPAIFKRVANSPASRFWVSEERAAVVIAAMMQGKKIPKMRGNKKQMFDEIFARVCELKQTCPRLSLHQLVAKVIYQPAPKFYLTTRTVGELIYRIKKQGEHGNKQSGTTEKTI